MQAERRAVGGLGRRARQNHRLRAEVVVVGEKFVDQEGSDEQGAQQHLLRLGVCAVAGIGAGAQILVVDLVQAFSMGCPVEKSARVDTLRLQDQMAGHRKITVETLADTHAIAIRCDHVAESPHRHAAPGRIGGGEEMPVPHGVAEGGVGDVVRGQRELVHPDQNRARRQGCGQRRAHNPGGPQVIPADLDIDNTCCGSLVHAVASP